LQKESGPFAVTVTEGAVQDFSPARIDWKGRLLHA
jgi:hypothetical protein